MSRHLVWLRSDLRIADNPALFAACQDSNSEVIALWIATPEQWQKHNTSARQLKYWYDALQILSEDLLKLGIPLQIIQSTDFTGQVDQLANYCQHHHITRTFYNYQYELNERQRDENAEKLLAQQGIICQGFYDGTLLAPGSVVTEQGSMYKVFTPFKRAVIKLLQQQLPETYPVPNPRHIISKLKPSPIPHFYPKDSDYSTKQFPAEHQAVLHQLHLFLKHSVTDYAVQRDKPAVDGTSSLSPALTSGVLSVRQCLQQLLKYHPKALLSDQPANVWLNELIWRDFYRHLLVAWPDLCRHKPFQAWTDKVRWRQDPSGFTAWSQGKTGIPIVDAAMRQLNTTGWMHNRLRMICASFLVKDLLIDWREGEKYFISQLIDGDLAANNGGWQWAASTGTDAAPYFRIFNPIRQSERFDPDGEFIRKWLPELDIVPSKYLHEPWRWAEKQQQFLDYPKPIVNHHEARKQTLAAFEAARADK